MNTLLRYAAVLVLATSATANAAVTKEDTEVCLSEARSHAAAAYAKTRSAIEARKQLEIEAARCFDPALSAEAANAIGTVNADRARLAQQFVTRKLTLTAYRAARKDRTRKAAALLADPKAQRDLLAGDADGDLVPDATDRCAKTAPDAPTDARGCPIPVRPGADDEEQERKLRATLEGSRTLFNRSCDNAPRPEIPSPIVWGRGAQTRFNTQGFNLAVSKVDGQPQGCEILYEIQLRFSEPNPGNPLLPPAKIVTITFSQSEDLLPTAGHAVFGIPVGNMTLSPGRSIAREAMLREYFKISWRVRAVNGSNQTSPWSPFITQGPAPAGVPG